MRVSITYNRGISLAAVSVALAVGAKDLNGTAEDTVTADLVVLGRADRVVATARLAVASLDIGRSSDGSGGHGEDGSESRELHFEELKEMFGFEGV